MSSGGDVAAEEREKGKTMEQNQAMQIMEQGYA
jgi:hypothetical protein